MSIISDLQAVLQYQNPEIIARFKRDHPDKAPLAESIFTELLKYLYLTQKHLQDRRASRSEADYLQFTCVIHTEMCDIDDMWHTFLLFTLDYANFCETYFENFIHHVPNIVAQPTISVNEYQLELTRYLSYIADNLGENTLMSWFGGNLVES